MKQQIVMQRTWAYPLADLWELWTTKDGIESWWGPDGFETKVLRLELRVGGALEYTFTAVGAEQIVYMQQAGEPLVTHLHGKYVAVEPMTVVAWNNLTDFIQGIEPYEVETRVELQPTPHGVLMTLRFDVMHEERWTQLAKAGWENELQKLERQLLRRRPNP